MDQLPIEILRLILSPVAHLRDAQLVCRSWRTITLNIVSDNRRENLFHKISDLCLVSEANKLIRFVRDIQELDKYHKFMIHVLEFPNIGKYAAIGELIERRNEIIRNSIILNTPCANKDEETILSLFINSYSYHNDEKTVIITPYFSKTKIRFRYDGDTIYYGKMQGSGGIKSPREFNECEEWNELLKSSFGGRFDAEFLKYVIRRIYDEYFD
jgi:hypothetical protein